MWQLITPEEVQTRLTGAEITAFSSKALATGQGDPLPPILAQVAREVRGHVAAGGNTLGEGLTIPDELLAAALDMVAYRLTTRLGLTVKDERKAAYEQADRLLVRVAAGQLRVVAPETPASTQAAGASIALVHSRTRLTGRMEGL